jgi:RimJ/RimL family protein N-acetyltransferase
MTDARSTRFSAPLRLEGTRLLLRPLVAGDATPLSRAGGDPEIWKFMRTGPVTDSRAMARLIEMLLGRQSEGTDLAFTIVEQVSGTPIGMTRFLHIDRDNDAVEVGGTWLARRFWRGPYNTESKLLMLRHAFEVERVHRVELRTDLRNERSQWAIQRLGATREGVLREESLLGDGYRRSTVVYSILEDEWPMVRDRLVRFLRRPWVARSATG